MNFVQVILADDHSVVLAGIRSLLPDFCEVLEEVTDGHTLVDRALRLRPDLIILDISMPVLNGIDAARQIKRIWPEARLLFLSMHASPMYLREALDAGGSGYVLKSSAVQELRSAIDRVMKERTFISQAFGRDVLQSLETTTGRLSRSSMKLTARQREILQLIAEGRSNKEMAALLHVSAKTVEFHRARIMIKLGVHTAAELSAIAAREGLVG